MKPFSVIASVVFAGVALVQLSRVIQGWSAVINGFAVPIWASAVAFLVASVLSIMVWREARR